MRDVLIHQYFGVNLDTVWATVERRLPDLKRAVLHRPGGPRALRLEDSIVLKPQLGSREQVERLRHDDVADDGSLARREGGAAHEHDGPA